MNKQPHETHERQPIHLTKRGKALGLLALLGAAAGAGVAGVPAATELFHNRQEQMGPVDVSKLPPDKLTTITIRAGDTASEIAQEYTDPTKHDPAQLVATIQQQGAAGSVLQAGQTVRIPDELISRQPPANNSQTP